MIPTITLGKTDEKVPVLGQGTWKMGLDPAIRDQEIAALRTGIEHGMTLIDTAEVYSEGESERIVGEVIQDCRDDIFLVTKVWPTNGTYDGVRRAAEGSLKRLRTDRIDLYLLHWPSADHPVAETMRGMRALVEEGIIRYVGVSNFSAELMQEAIDALGDIPLAVNQVVYHMKNRVIEHSVKPFCDKNRVTIMAYSPFGAGSFPEPGSPGRRVLGRSGPSTARRRTRCPQLARRARQRHRDSEGSQSEARGREREGHGFPTYRRRDRPHRRGVPASRK